MTTKAYENELEQYFGELPGWLQSPLRPAFETMDKWLKAVAGNPDELLRARGVYTRLAEQVRHVGRQQKADRGKLQGDWDGPAYQTFTKKMEQLEKQIGHVADTIGKTPQVLEAAAKACVEAANMIVEIVLMLVGFLITQFVVNAVLDVLTLGANIAAQVAEAIATCATALARILSVVARLAQVLEKIAMLFKKIAEILKGIKTYLEGIKDILQITRDLSGFTSKGGLLAKGATIGIQAGVMQGANPVISAASGGHLKVPGAVGGSIHVGEDIHGANQDIEDERKITQDAREHE